MEYDCGFKKGDNWFRYRTGGILIHDNKMLFVKSNFGDYYYMIGGGVHWERLPKSVLRGKFLRNRVSACKRIILQLCAKTFSKETAEPLTGFIVTK